MRNQLGKRTGDTVVLTSLTPKQFKASLSQDSEIVPAGPTLNTRIAGVVRTPEDVTDTPDPFLSLTPGVLREVPRCGWWLPLQRVDQC